MRNARRICEIGIYSLKYIRRDEYIFFQSFDTERDVKRERFSNAAVVMAVERNRRDR